MTTAANDSIVRRASLASVVVWTLWGLMLGVAVACIARYATNVPFAEDWTMVPALTGNEPDLLAWLWSQNNEHRVPLSRLIYLVLLEASGGDFRAGMLFNVAVYGAVTAAMILTARRLRGRTALADAFFPLAFLHLGHWINMFWGWQIQFVTSAALMLVLLAVVARQAGPLRGGAAAWTAAAIVLLPLTGASGVIVAAIMGPWVLLAAWGSLRGGHGSRRAAVALLVALAVAALTSLLYFVGYTRPTWNPPSPSHLATLRTAAMFLSYGWGPAASMAWAPAVLGAIAVLAPAAWFVARAALRERGSERVRAVGFLLFGVAMLVLALGIGYGRAAQLATVGLPYRYVLFAVPAFCFAWFAWRQYGPRQAGRVVPALLALALALLLPFNTRRGLDDRDWYLRHTDAVRRDIAAGSDAASLGARHREFLMRWNERALVERLEMLRRAGIAPFARLEPPR